MHFTSHARLDDDVLERDFTLDGIPGVLWTSGTDPAPLILSGHPGGLHKRIPRLVARARHYAARYGFAVAAIDAPGCGERPRSPADEQARADLARALGAGEPVEQIIETLLLPMLESAVPEWQTTLDALQALPEVGERVGYEGMPSIGIRLAVLEPRLRAAVLFGMSFVPAAVREQATEVRMPVQFLLQWDDEGMDRQPVLDLYDALGSREKTLHANLGGHAGTPWFEVDDGARFFVRHLR